MAGGSTGSGVLDEGVVVGGSTGSSVARGVLDEEVVSEPCPEDTVVAGGSTGSGVLGAGDPSPRCPATAARGAAWCSPGPRGGRWTCDAAPAASPATPRPAAPAAAVRQPGPESVPVSVASSVGESIGGSCGASPVVTVVVSGSSFVGAAEPTGA